MGSNDNIQRTVLPIPDQPHVGLTTFDAKDPDTKYPPIKELRPPKGAPNVVVVLLDDVGFGAAVRLEARARRQFSRCSQRMVSSTTGSTQQRSALPPGRRC